MSLILKIEVKALKLATHPILLFDEVSRSDATEIYKHCCRNTRGRGDSALLYLDEELTRRADALSSNIMLTS